MPMTATMAPYTLFILDDDTPMNPREDHDCLGKNGLLAQQIQPGRET